ncbi:MAG: hypothetical protein JWN30_2097 [Bacilli bacterium]|nr:hypothetical protein [Bacilli bacterium]
MNEFHLLARQTVKITSLITLLVMALWALLPMPWRPTIAGFATGAAVSCYFALSVARQIEIATQLALGHAKRKPGIAVLSRMAMVIVGAFVVSRAHWSVGMFLLGIFVYQIVVLVIRFKPGREGQGSDS